MYNVHVLKMLVQRAYHNFSWFTYMYMWYYTDQSYSIDSKMPRKGIFGHPMLVPVKRLQTTTSRKRATGSTTYAYRRAFGSLYYSRTQKMKAAENKLVWAGAGHHNMYKRSTTQTWKQVHYKQEKYTYCHKE